MRFSTLALFFLLGALGSDHTSSGALAADSAHVAVESAVRPVSGCATCHDHSLVPQPDHRSLEFDHFPEIRKCGTCHVAHHVERLQLLTGDRATSTAELCGQCHGIVKRNWDRGIHGKQVGGWQKSTPLTCTGCHNPHVPKFKQMKAQAAPTRPRLGIQKGDDHE